MQHLVFQDVKWFFARRERASEGRGAKTNCHRATLALPCTPQHRHAPARERGLRIVDQLHLLRQALALGQQRNFARAAESLNMTQPSLTRGIAALERSMGVPLFERTRKGVVPTPFGRVLIERAETLLRRHSDLRRELQLLSGLEEGTLAVAAGPYAAETSVAQTLARLVGNHPRLRIEFTVADPQQVVQDVLAGRVDVGVARIVGLEREKGLVLEALPPLRVYLACRPGHPLTQEAQPSLARVLQFPLATITLRGPQAALAATGDASSTHEGSDDAEFAPQITVNSLAMARIIARGSNAIVPGTAAHLADDVAAGRLVRLPVESPALHSPHGIIYRRDRPLAPAAAAFIETLRLVESQAREADAASRASIDARSGRPLAPCQHPVAAGDHRTPDDAIGPDLVDQAKQPASARIHL